MWTARRLLLLTAIAVVPLACSSENDAVVVPTYRGEPNGDGAALVGELVIDGRCLYVASPGGERTLIAFPERSLRWDPDARRVSLSAGSASVGQRVVFGGSARARTQIPDGTWEFEPLDDCAGDFVWMAGDSILLDTP